MGSARFVHSHDVQDPRMLRKLAKKPAGCPTLLQEEADFDNGNNGNSRKSARPIYAAQCMSIRSALQAAASPSDRSVYLLRIGGQNSAENGCWEAAMVVVPPVCVRFYAVR